MALTNPTARNPAAYTLLAVAVLAILIVPVGSAVFLLGFVRGDSPCVMCWEQRIGMILIALIGLFVLRYGARPKYIGVAMIVATWGVFAGLRHTASHAARDVGQGFSAEILGAHTYTWSLFVFWMCALVLGLLLTMLRQGVDDEGPRVLRPIDRVVSAVLLIVVAGNIVQAFASTGPPPFMGQSDPVRFSFNPRHWVWSTEEWSPAPVGLRGRWAIETPDAASVPADPTAGPIGNVAALAGRQQKRLALSLRGTPTGLSYDPAGDRFALSTQQGVYIVDSTFDRILRYTVVDPGYSVDLGRLAGVAFLDSTTVIAVGENKSFVVLRENDRTDPNANFRFFLESFNKFDEVSRSRFATVRARMMYTMSIAFDPITSSLFTFSVPNSKVKRLVVSRFDRRDMTLSEEFVPALGTASGLRLAGDTRSLDDLFVTAATVADNRLLGLSTAYSTLLTIDPTTRAVVDARALQGLVRPAGIAVRGSELYIVGEDRTLTVTEWKH
jgi:disulfide bond formation protein DsbB